MLNQMEMRARCQALIHANALAGAGQIRHLALELLNAPARPYDDVTIQQITTHDAERIARCVGVHRLDGCAAGPLGGRWHGLEDAAVPDPV